jgi:hypothetical protein
MVNNCVQSDEDVTSRLSRSMTILQEKSSGCVGLGNGYISRALLTPRGLMGMRLRTDGTQSLTSTMLVGLCQAHKIIYNIVILIWFPS